MYHRYKDPMMEWFNKNPQKNELQHRMWLWAFAEHSIADGRILRDKVIAWLNNDPLSGRRLYKGAPNLVLYALSIAKARVLTRNWKKLPIEIPEEDYPAWREHNHAVNIDELRAQRNGILGGFLLSVALEPNRVGELLRQQVKDKITDLRAAVDRPLEYYTPEDFDEDEMLEGFPEREKRKFNEPFQLAENFEYFKLGLETARLHASDDNPELGLPNDAVFDALVSVHLNEISQALAYAEPKLKAIMKHLVKHRYFKLDDDLAPKTFWWRHQKELSQKRRRD